MAEFSTTRITPGDNVQFPAVNGQVTGYVQGSDMATKAQLDDAVTSLKYHIDTSNLIDTITWATGSAQYTCTEDCYLIFTGRMQANSRGIMTITINGDVFSERYTIMAFIYIYIFKFH